MRDGVGAVGAPNPASHPRLSEFPIPASHPEPMHAPPAAMHPDAASQPHGLPCGGCWHMFYCPTPARRGKPRRFAEGFTVRGENLGTLLKVFVRTRSSPSAHASLNWGFSEGMGPCTRVWRENLQQSAEVCIGRPKTFSKPARFAHGCGPRGPGERGGHGEARVASRGCTPDHNGHGRRGCTPNRSRLRYGRGGHGKAGIRRERAPRSQGA